MEQNEGKNMNNCNLTDRLESTMKETSGKHIHVTTHPNALQKYNKPRVIPAIALT